MNIEKRLIPINFSYGRPQKIEAVMIHIMEGTLMGCDSWFRDANAQVSSHYGIGKDGRILQWVEEQNTAWHAGGIQNPKAEFTKYHNLYDNVNGYTIGIECEGHTGERFTDLQIKAIQYIITMDAKNYGWDEYIYGKNLLEHASINKVSRASCPGTGIHMTNDLIIPVNKQLKGNTLEGKLKETLLKDNRKDVVDKYPTNTLDWMRDYGYVFEAMFQLGQLGRNDVRQAKTDCKSFAQWYVDYGYQEYKDLGLSFWTATSEQVRLAQDIKNNNLNKLK